MAFAGTGKIWMNGTLVNWADAKIHVASHVIHYGSGVFEGARCYDTKKGPACLRKITQRRQDDDVYRIVRSAKQSGSCRRVAGRLRRIDRPLA